MIESTGGKCIFVEPRRNFGHAFKSFRHVARMKARSRELDRVAVLVIKSLEFMEDGLRPSIGMLDQGRYRMTALWPSHRPELLRVPGRATHAPECWAYGGGLRKIIRKVVGAVVVVVDVRFNQLWLGLVRDRGGKSGAAH
jgi:hypothetical protein